MIIGFTGAREGMTAEQREYLSSFAANLVEQTTVHHGDCVGSDQTFHLVAVAKGWQTVIHPPTIDKHRAYCTHYTVLLPPKPYLERNRDIVDACDFLIATPKTEHEVIRSGTWSTVRYAKDTGKPGMIICPSGRVENFEGKSK